jgi:hypothetical protein
MGEIQLKEGENFSFLLFYVVKVLFSKPRNPLSPPFGHLSPTRGERKYKSVLRKSICSVLPLEGSFMMGTIQLKEGEDGF